MDKKFIEILPEICQRLNLITEYDLCRTTESEMIYLLAEKLNELMVKHNDDMVKVNDKFIVYDDKLRYLLDQGLTNEVKKILNQMYADGTLQELVVESMVDINRRIVKNTRLIENRTKGKLYYEDFKENSSGFSETITKILEIAKEGEEIIIPPGVYNASSTITIKKGVNFDFNGATVIYEKNGVLFETNFSEDKKIIFRNIVIRMNLGVNSTAFGLDKTKDSIFENVRIGGGAYGFYITNSYLYEFKNVTIYNPQSAGIYIQGDGGAEAYANTVYIGFSAKNFAGGYGLQMERTTTTDKGAYYFNNFLVVKNTATGATSKGGIKVNSTVQNSIVVLNLIGGGADGYGKTEAANGIYALDITNCVNFKITNAWINSIKCKRVEDFNMTCVNNPYGLYLKGNASLVNAIISNISCAEDTFVKYDSDATTGNIWVSNVRTGLIANDMTKFNAKNQNKKQTNIVASSTVADDTFFIRSTDNNKKVFMRITGDGALEMLNEGYSGMLQFTPQGGIKKAGTNVINAEPKAWQRATNNEEFRGPWATNTVTLQQLAGLFNALLTDLKTWHGLIK